MRRAGSPTDNQHDWVGTWPTAGWRRKLWQDLRAHPSAPAAGPATLLAAAERSTRDSVLVPRTAVLFAEADRFANGVRDVWRELLEVAGYLPQGDAQVSERMTARADLSIALVVLEDPVERRPCRRLSGRAQEQRRNHCQ